MWRRQIVSITSLSLISSSVISCATWNVSNNVDQIDKNVKQAQQDMDNTKSTAANNFIREVDGGIFAAHASKMKDTAPLPAVFYDSYTIDRSFTGLHEVAEALYRLTGLLVSVDSSTLTATASEGKVVRIAQKQGTLVNLLDAIAVKYDVAWSFHEGTIEFNQYETRSWTINSVPGDYSLQNSLSNAVGIQGQNSAGGASLTGNITGGGSTDNGSQGGNSNGQSGGGQGGGASVSNSGGSSSQSNSAQSSSSLTFSTSASVWDSISNTVKSMLSDKGKLNIAPADATLTVTDRPHIIRLVERYVHNENMILGRQVRLEVKVYAVQLDNNDTYGWNWNAIINNSPVALQLDNTKTFSANNAASFTLKALSGNMTNSQAVIAALSTEHKVSVVTTASVITHNNQPAPVQSVLQTSYVASSQTTQVNNAGAQTTITPGVVTTGFQMNALPNILANGEINLQVAINISELSSLNSFNAGNATVQIPQVETRNFMQKVSLRDGDTLVLSGFERNSNNLTEQGVGSASNWIFGGGINADKARSVIVVLVTPQIIATH